VFLISSILLILASYILFFSKEINVRVELNLLDSFDFKNLRKNLVHIIQGSSYVVSGFVWPLLLFFLNIKILSIGAFYLFSNLAQALVCYLSGSLADKKEKHRFITGLGTTGQGLSFIFRAVTTYSYAMAIFQTMGGLFGGLLKVSLDSWFYKHSHEKIGSAIMSRELYMHLGRMMMILFLLSLLTVYDIIDALIIVMITGASLLFILNLFIGSKKHHNSSHKKIHGAC
jgi:hypothetical protein